MSGTRAPSLKKEKEREIAPSKLNDYDEYSDPDEGVEIVDMENVRQMDWAAPESLHRDMNEGRRERAIKIKKEVPAAAGKPNTFSRRSPLIRPVDGISTGQVIEIEEVDASGEVDLANALDLSESEEDEELEDIIDDFSIQADMEQVRFPVVLYIIC
jgi:DNA-directed RNA polymerase III subunit RPC4